MGLLRNGRVVGIRGLILALLLACQGTAVAQWRTQTIDFEPGWNPVYLHVQPEPRGCDAVFTNAGVDVVSWWRCGGNGTEFDTDPSDPFPREAHWLSWHADDPELSSFSSLLSGEAYMVHVQSNVPPFSLCLKGLALLNPQEWHAGELVLTGMPAGPTNPATFFDFFHYTDEIPVNFSDGGEIYRVDDEAMPQRVFNPSVVAIDRSEAYWIRCGDVSSIYNGPLQVSLESAARAIGFGDNPSPATLRIKNLDDSERMASIRHLASLAPPDGQGLPPLAGRIPLMYARSNWPESIHATYEDLPDFFQQTIGAGETLQLKLMPRIGALSNAAPGSAWQSVLQVSDEGNEGAEPVAVHYIGASCGAAAQELADPTGLWVGDATVTGVSRAPTRAGTTPAWDETEPLPVARPFPFRVILHMDDYGEARLLQRALLVWHELGDAAAGISTNGSWKLFWDEAHAKSFASTNASAIVQRISSVNFPSAPPLALAGEFVQDGTLESTVRLEYNDPLNPYVHVHHPQHDNLKYASDGTASTLPEADAESWLVRRDLRFVFAPEDPLLGSANLRWGISERGGTYLETVRGLNKTLYVSGSFRLRRVSEIGIIEYLSSDGQ